MSEEAQSAERERDRRLADAAAVADALVVQHLVEALTQLQQDLDRVELWAAALSSFLRPVPHYKLTEQYLLPPFPRSPDPRKPTGRSS